MEKNICSKYGIVFVLFLILFVSSCKPQKEPETNDIKFDTISISRVHHLENDSTQPSCNLKINFIYPSYYSDVAILSEIQKEFISVFFDDLYRNESPLVAVDKYAEDYKKGYLEDASVFFKDKNDPEISDDYFSYYESISTKINFNKANLLSFQVTRNNYKGGATSFQVYNNYVINLKTGHLLLEEDIFKPGYEKVINPLFIQKMLLANSVTKLSDLEELGYFGIDEMMPNSNFWLDEKGITYTFNKGEYSVLQLDEVNIFLTYQELSLVLKEESPISVFFDK